MTNTQIFKTSLSLSSTKIQLWVLGIFLSSGFNFHWWYVMAWFKRSGFLGGIKTYLNDGSIILALLVLFLIFGASLIIFNLVKIYFFGLVHSYIHPEAEEKCLLCSKLNDQKSFRTLFFRIDIVWRVCLASLITVGMTSVTLGLFNFYNTHADVNLITQVVLLACMLTILIGISLWNLVSVLLILFYNFSFAKAASFAVDLLSINFKRVLGFITVLTMIFLIAVTAGALVISRIPEIFGVTSIVFFADNLQFAWYSLITVASVGVLLVWIVLNNVFFNVSLIILFDSLVRLIKDEQGIALKSHNPVNQVVTHHSELES